MPADMVTALEGLVVVFVVSLEYMRRRSRAPPPTPRALQRPGARAASAGAVAGRRRRAGRPMSQFFTYAILTATVASALGLAAPFLLAALGETMGQRSGVINLGVDGIMLLSAFTTYYTALKTNNLLVAVLVGMATGAVMGVVTAFISVTLKAEQGISGIGIYLFGLGFSDLMFISS